MRSDRLKSLLGKMYGPGTVDQRRKKALEDDLLSRYRELHPKNRRWLMMLNPWNRTARFVLTGLALCVIVVGACSRETTTEVELGKQMQLDLAAGAEDRSAQSQYDLTFEFLAQEEVTLRAEAMSKLLAEQPGVENASVSINQQSNGEVSVNVLAWGKDLDTDELLATLAKDYPVLANAHVSIDDLNATVTETYAAKFAREVFRIEVTGSDPEELRAQVLEKLAAQGFEGDATVHVDTDGDQSTITIELEEE